MASTDYIPHELLKSLLEMIRMTDDVDVLRDSTQWLIEQLLEADVTQQIGASRYEHTETRTTQRNGTRDRGWDTRLGHIPLKIPKLRKGSYYPDWLLDRSRPTEKALVGVIMEAYVNGISTRKMERVVKEMGLEGMDKSRVSRINQGLDQRVERFMTRPLEGPYPYVWLDATFPKVREDGRVQSTALVTAIGVNQEGYREILGISLGSSENESFWKAFLRRLVERGLTGVRLVISDAHQGLQNAASQVLTGASWQRCRTHFMRDILTHVPASGQSEVTELIRTIFEQPNREHAQRQTDRIVAELEHRFSKAAGLLEQAREDLMAHMHFPKSHWRKLRSTNPLERLHREIKRRFRVVGIFPNRSAVMRLGGALLLEQHEEWISGRRYFSEASIAEVLNPAEHHRLNEQAAN